MTQKSSAGTRAEREAEKARRLADALRANLGRRKARRRSIAEEPGEPAADPREAPDAD